MTNPECSSCSALLAERNALQGQVKRLTLERDAAEEALLAAREQVDDLKIHVASRDSQLAVLLRELCPDITPYPTMNEARDRIKALQTLEAENVRLREALERTEHGYSDQIRLYREMRADRDRLKEALTAYGQHKAECGSSRSCAGCGGRRLRLKAGEGWCMRCRDAVTLKPCTCGLEAALHVPAGGERKDAS